MSEPRGPIPEPLYSQIRESVPIVTVELLPWRPRPEGGIEVLLIRRLDRNRRHCWCWVGGRLHLGESIADAAARQLAETLGPDARFGQIDPASPAAVVEYAPGHRDDGPFDEEQHSISLTYLCRHEAGEPEPLSEANEVGWFGTDELPDQSEFSFGNYAEVRRVAELAAALA